LHYKASLEAVNRLIGMHELIGKDPFHIYEGQPWFELVKKRI